jgi:hypothetical protein
MMFDDTPFLFFPTMEKGGSGSLLGVLLPVHGDVAIGLLSAMESEQGERSLAVLGVWSLLLSVK